MSVIRIAEAVQPTAWMRTFDSARAQFQESRPGVPDAWMAGIEALLVMLNPAALVAFVLAAWRLGQDLDWTGNFFIPQGLFSHWQVWLAAGFALKTGHVLLSRWQVAQKRQPQLNTPAPAVHQHPISRAA